MNQGGGTLLGDMWRATPRGWKVVGAVVLLGLAAWGISRWVEGIRRARLKAEVEAFLATLPALPVEPPVAEADDAAPVLLEAMGAVNRGALKREFYAANATPWTTPPAEVEAGLAKNTEALRLLELAVGKPSFAPPSVTGGTSGTGWDLSTLAYTRSLVELRAGRITEAVNTALLVPRMRRLVGPGRTPPWNLGSNLFLCGIEEILEAAVADPCLDAASAEAILRHLPSAEESRRAEVANFEGEAVRDGGRRIAEMLADDAEDKARAAGWRPPTLHQRLMAKIGKGRLPFGMDAFPSASDIRSMWKTTLDLRAVLGSRGPEAVRRLAAIPPPVNPGIYVEQYAAQAAQSLRTQFTVEARLEVIRAAAALRLFEMRKGRWATSLAELVPEFLPGPTRDPYTDGPLLYEADAVGWRVSSAGPGVEWPFMGQWKDVRPSIRWGFPAGAKDGDK